MFESWLLGRRDAPSEARREGPGRRKSFRSVARELRIVVFSLLWQSIVAVSSKSSLRCVERELRSCCVVERERERVLAEHTHASTSLIALAEHSHASA